MEYVTCLFYLVQEKPFLVRMCLMKTLLIFFIIFSSIAFASSKDYFVLSAKNSGEEIIDKEMVRNIYLGNKLFWKSGKRILPVHLKVTDSSFQAFLEEVINMDKTQFTSYWRRKLFSGRAYPPKQLERDDLIIEYVRDNTDGIGVISNIPESYPSDIKFLEIN